MKYHHQLLASIIFFALAAAASAQNIKVTSPENLENYISEHSQDKPLLVHFSSTDKNCGFCRKNNKLMLKASKTLGDKYHFVQLNFNPWRSISRYKTLQAHYKDLGFPIASLPTSIIYYKNQARLYDSGVNDNLIDDLKNNIALVKKTKGRTSNKPIAIKMDTIMPAQLAHYSAKHSTQKPLVVHFSSSDKSCGYCIRDNVKVDAVIERLSDKYNFVRLDFNPWQSLNNNKPLLDDFIKIGKPIQGLPTTVIYYKNIVKVVSRGERRNPLAFFGNHYDTVRGMGITDEFKKEVSNIQLPIITPSQLDHYALTQSKDKPLIVHITSQDEACVHCISSNAYIRDAYRHHKQTYDFVELSYNPWRTFNSDKHLKQHLAKYRLSLNGLPATVIYYKANISGLIRGKNSDLSKSLGAGYQAITTQVYRKR